MEFLSFFSDLHWDVLLKIIGVDIVLGLDNAIVIALACAMLAPELRNKAVIIGTAGAILARILFLFIGFVIVGIPFVKILAGGYLVYLAYGMMKGGDDDAHNITAKPTVWGAAITIVVADLLMSLDNVVALVGAAEGTGDHAFGYTVFGIVLSIPIIIFASKGLMGLIDKFPVITWLGGALIAWVGVEMILKEDYNKIAEIMQMQHSTNMLVAGAITLGTVALCYFKNRKASVTA